MTITNLTIWPFVKRLPWKREIRYSLSVTIGSVDVHLWSSRTKPRWICMVVESLEGETERCPNVSYVSYDNPVSALFWAIDDYIGGDWPVWMHRLLPE